MLPVLAVAFLPLSATHSAACQICSLCTAKAALLGPSPNVTPPQTFPSDGARETSRPPPAHSSPKSGGPLGILNVTVSQRNLGIHTNLLKIDDLRT